MVINVFHIYDERPYVKNQRPVTPNLFPLFKAMREYSIIVLDGPPGIGKTTLYTGLMWYLRMRGLPFELVTSDDDVLERKKRGDKELIEYHQGINLGEVLNTHLRMRSYTAQRHIEVPMMKYNGKTGCIDIPHTYHVPKPGEGMLLIEGVRSVKLAVKRSKKFANKISKVLFVMIHKSREIVNKQRYMRDRYQKGLSKEVIFHRIHTQERVIQAYYHDLARDLSETTLYFQNKSWSITLR